MIQINSTEDLIVYGIGEHGSDRYDDPGAWCKPNEAMIIYAALQAMDTKIVYESGTCNGWSASWAALAMGEEGHVYTFDIIDKPKIYASTALEPRITQTISPFSEGVKPFIRSRNPDDKIAVFIDGDHSTEVCKADLAAVEPYLRVNDLVFFHDTRRSKYDGILKTYERMIKQGMYEGINFAATRNGIAVVRKCHKR